LVIKHFNAPYMMHCDTLSRLIVKHMPSDLTALI
jgi:hypothetical protein